MPFNITWCRIAPLNHIGLASTPNYVMDDMLPTLGDHHHLCPNMLWGLVCKSCGLLGTIESWGRHQIVSYKKMTHSITYAYIYHGQRAHPV